MSKRTILLAAICLPTLVAAIATAFGAWSLLGHDGHRWTHRTTVAGVPISVPVAASLRLATTSVGGWLLHERRFERRIGLLELHWNSAQEQLEVTCAPCRIRFAALSADPIEIRSLRVSVHRSADRLSGEFAAGDLRGHWRGTMGERQLVLAAELPETALASLYALFGAAIPETAIARIAGRFSATATWRMPEGELEVEPRLRVDAIAGLGTGGLRGLAPRPRCSAAPLFSTDEPPPTVASSAQRAKGGRRALRAAVIAAEDQHFYEHAGFDPSAIAAWLSLNAERGSIVGGASTITQQLAKLLYVGDERTHVRKLRELLYAVEMERTLGKAHILDLYLAIVPWGPGICGADAAAGHYFGKEVDDLTVAEAAWMAGMLRNPQRAAEDPAGHVERALWVVDGMTRFPRAQRRSAHRELARPIAWK